MQKFIITGISIFILWGCSGKPVDTTANNKSMSPSSGDSIIQRIVCFKFKADATPASIQQHMSGFAMLKDSISYILSYSAGPTVLGDLTEKPEYDVMHYCTYKNEEEIKLYSSHPVHQRFIEQNKAIWEKVLVINSKVKP